MVFRHRHSQILEYGDDLGRSSVFRTQTVTTTYDNRSIFCAIEAVFNIQIQRFAVSTRFFCTIEYCDCFGSLRYGSHEMFGRERTVQVNCNQTYFLALAGQVVDSFAGSFGYRTHGDDYAFCIFGSVVVEQTVFASCDLGNLVHVFLNDGRNSVIVVVA